MSRVRGPDKRPRQRLSGSPVERFWARVPNRPAGQCWNWAGGTTVAGYGELRVDGAMKYTHRISYELHHGPIPSGSDVLHSCDIPACVNPDHLFLGDAKANSRDMFLKGRQGAGYPARFLGSEHPQARLSESDVLEIRCLYATGNYTQRALAGRFAVSQRNISFITCGLHWRHILPTTLQGTP